MPEIIKITDSIETSPDIGEIIQNLGSIGLAKGVPTSMEPLLTCMKRGIAESVDHIAETGRAVFVAGPDWCRNHSETAGEAHAEVIINAYGSSYALPNKNPQVNKEALDSRKLDMFLMFDKQTMRPTGTACMVLNGGWAELGRAASLGHVGNRLIQDLRILRWLTNENLSQQYHSLFATLRTAPDRNIGSNEETVIMRGGQAVSHIWGEIPSVFVAGFGPLYKKHGALEQFAFAFITQKNIGVPESLWIASEGDESFVRSWLNHYEVPVVTANRFQMETEGEIKVDINFPPQESGITNLVHGEMTIAESGGLPLEEGLKTLESAGVPFVQFPVPIENDTRGLQTDLNRQGFQTFQFTPALEGVQPAFLWFGKILTPTPVVSTFWEQDLGKTNPFWQGDLGNAQRIISQKW